MQAKVSFPYTKKQSQLHNLHSQFLTKPFCFGIPKFQAGSFKKIRVRASLTDFRAKLSGDFSQGSKGFGGENNHFLGTPVSAALISSHRELMIKLPTEIQAESPQHTGMRMELGLGSVLPGSLQWAADLFTASREEIKTNQPHPRKKAPGTETDKTRCLLSNSAAFRIVFQHTEISAFTFKEY